jgi:hypothetical protein
VESASRESKPEKLRFKTLAALSFVALVWVLITLAGLSKARAVGWPACLTDQAVLALMPISLAILAGVVVYYCELMGVGARQSSSPTGDSSSVPLATLVPHRDGSGFAASALGLPVITGVVLLFVTSFWVAIGINAATVFLTALLLALDARRLGVIDQAGRRRETAGTLFIGMLVMWIVVYTLAFFRRRHFGGPNLAVPSMVVAAFFAVGPIFPSVLSR